MYTNMWLGLGLGLGLECHKFPFDFTVANRRQDDKKDGKIDF